MSNIFIQLFAALVGSFGFSLIFNSGKKSLIPASLGGMLGWGVYLLFTKAGLGVFLSTICAAAFCQVYSEIFARVLKCPTTVFYIPSIIALVPGGALYYTMHYASLTDWTNFRHYGVQTLQVAFGIAIGTSFVSAILLLLPKYRSKK